MDEDDVTLELEQEKDLHVGGAARILLRERRSRVNEGFRVTRRRFATNKPLAQTVI